jgi:ATP-dependent RNA helicase HelY
LSIHDFNAPVDPVERIRIPQWFSPRSARHRRDLASTLRTKVAHRDVGRPPRSADGGIDDTEIVQLRKRIRSHPCHGCPDREDHARWGERYLRLERETAGLRRRVDSRSQVIARTFDRVCALLDQLGYLDGDAVTEEGRRLGRIYSELDLLTAECLRGGVWSELAPAELAACVSALVYESRQADDNRSPRTPHGPAHEALTSMLRLWEELDAIEGDHRLSFLREPDLGFAWAAYRWAKGDRLDAVLDDTGLAAGDFVRWVRQLLDLLGQLHDAAPEDSRVRQSAPAAMDALRRGVVAYTSVTYARSATGGAPGPSRARRARPRRRTAYRPLLP